MTTRRKIALIGLVVIFVGIQWFGPARTNPPVTLSHTIQSQLQIPVPVTAILNRSCMDCHSYETHWPVYGRIAPLSWWFVDNVNDGRNALNFSEWSEYRPSYAIGTLDAISEAVEEDAMPPDAYEKFRAHGKLSHDERKIIYDWAQDERHRLQVQLLDTGKAQKATVQ